MLETERLILRAFRDEDRAPWAAMNADPEVMAHFPARLSRTEADEVIDRVNRKIAETGVGFWALERKADGVFLGFAGLNCIGHEKLPVFGLWEVGWRLARDAWGHGYATEAGAAALAHGFETMGLERIFAYTAASNRPSMAVMERLAMVPAPDMAFDHPMYADGSPSRPQHVYVKNA